MRATIHNIIIFTAILTFTYNIDCCVKDFNIDCILVVRIYYRAALQTFHDIFSFHFCPIPMKVIGQGHKPG